jgi:hypothetical protein
MSGTLPRSFYGSADGPGIQTVYLAGSAPDGSGAGAAVQAGGYAQPVAGSFTRPADTTAYAVGDLIANSTAAASVALTFQAARMLGGNGRITGARAFKSNPSLTAAQMRLHLFRLKPVPTVGDNGVFNSGTALACNMALASLGYFDFTFDRAFSDGAHALAPPNVGAQRIFGTPTTSMDIFGLVEARAAYTPLSAETFTFILEVDRD